MNHVDFLLQEVNILRLKLLERQSKEETFNLFPILLNERDEKNLHSRFISVLLDPRAPHKMGNTFLSLFLGVVESNMQVDDAEISISPNYLNPSEFKHIDIFIRKGNESAVIIENKIDATDSNHEGEGQLENIIGKPWKKGIQRIISTSIILRSTNTNRQKKVFPQAENIPNWWKKYSVFLTVLKSLSG